MLIIRSAVIQKRIILSYYDTKYETLSDLSYLQILFNFDKISQVSFLYGIETESARGALKFKGSFLRTTLIPILPYLHQTTEHSPPPPRNLVKFAVFKRFFQKLQAEL